MYYTIAYIIQLSSLLLWHLSLNNHQNSQNERKHCSTIWFIIIISRICYFFSSLISSHVLRKIILYCSSPNNKLVRGFIYHLSIVHILLFTIPFPCQLLHNSLTLTTIGMVTQMIGMTVAAPPYQLSFPDHYCYYFLDWYCYYCCYWWWWWRWWWGFLYNSQNYYCCWVYYCEGNSCADY